MKKKFFIFEFLAYVLGNAIIIVALTLLFDLLPTTISVCFWVLLFLLGILNGSLLQYMNRVKIKYKKPFFISSIIPILSILMVFLISVFINKSYLPLSESYDGLVIAFLFIAVCLYTVIIGVLSIVASFVTNLILKRKENLSHKNE